MNNTILYTVDAKGKKLGRIASEISMLLMGKNKPSYQRNVVAGVKVQVVNASQLSIELPKLESKEYTRYTGYPGGLRKETLERLIRRRGSKEALKRAVHGMLPSNKLRSVMLKNLFISE